MESESFRQLGLSEKSLAEIDKKGFEEPTEIQRLAIPLLLTTELDIIGQAKTGTGKTAAFGLPIIERIAENAGHVQALILVPTRELALQVSEELNSFKGKKKLHIMPVYGGQSMPEQIRKLDYGVDIVVGTPGRIMDHLDRGSLVIDEISYAVLDEADEMLNMGFIDDVEEIFKSTNPEKRTLLFSATMPDRIMNIAKKYMHEYRVISEKKETLTVDQTDQIYFEVANSDKLEALCRIIDIEDDFYGLIFCRTKVAVDELTNKLLDRGYEAEGIHGDFSQQQREAALGKFRKKRANILVATDVAARGIDISDLTHVINYSLPQDPESYIHRIGRTGRAGKKGIAITFISPSEYRALMTISRFTKTNIRKEKVPAIDDIISAKRNRLASDLLDIIAQDAHHEYKEISGQILDTLNTFEPRDVVAALLQYSFKNEFKKTSYNKISDVVSVDFKGTTRLFVSMGSKDGLTAKKLVHLIQNQAKVKAGRISEITVKDSFSFLTVPFAEAEIIIKEFKDKKGGRKPVISMADNKQGSKKNKDRGGRDRKRNDRSYAGDRSNKKDKYKKK